jgi:predicted AlkP superfamily phosphohydrolase/phosphomutase
VESTRLTGLTSPPTAPLDRWRRTVRRGLDWLPLGGLGAVCGLAMYQQLAACQQPGAPLQPESGGVLIAYIGPGAGIALVGSFLAVFTAILSALGIILTWPIRRIWRALRGRRALGRAQVRRVVVLGLDGLDPELAEQFLDEGLLPNLARLRAEGSYQRLGTSWPPLSPVAWSSFSTGTNPGRHNIFDFIGRNPKTYGPVISSVRMRSPRRTLRLGRYVVPLSRPEMTALRKSKPFWAVLGEAGIPSAVLRVPITFPPDRFAGLQLSAMCVPDLLGTQGTFAYYTERPVSPEAAAGDASGDVGGRQIRVERHGSRVTTYLEGPPNAFRADGADLRLPLSIESSGNGAALLKLGRQRVPLVPNEFSPWVRVEFPMAPGIKLRGICRFYLKQLSPCFEMYCTPLQIDPDKPAMPIAHPTVYSTYLARRQGPFATLGLAEDTWSLSEQLMTEDAFLDQAYSIHQERETMFFDALDRVRRGMVVCVFDGPDRIQHMFWRFLDPAHPALRGGANTHPHTIRDMYIRMDALVGQTLSRIDRDTALLVMSDHGFKPFRRGVDLNAWLREQGYLKLKEGATTSGRSYLADVDWQATKAYAVGLAGLYINQSGREGQGTVAAGEETRQLVAEIAARLTGLCDPETDQVAIAEAIPRAQAYSGPYVDAAPDIIVGYNVGYRVAWGSAVGKTSAEVFADNTKAWSGDHCIHPKRVPGVLFSNRKLADIEPNIIDIAPTTLELLGVKKPGYMEGKSLIAPRS